jgi:hypothetical protein
MFTGIGRVWLRAGVVLSLGCAAAGLFLGGCRNDSGPERVLVSGTITYDGKPIPGGEIRFMPLATSAVPMAGAEIKDGKYRVDGYGGVPVGTHKIEIDAYRADATGRKGNAPPSMMARGVQRFQYLPRRYNFDSQMRITIEPGSTEIIKNFDLKD